MLRVHVADNGRGIKAEDISKLFKSFGKIKGHADLNSEGIGLGLMVCKNLVERNEGTIEVDSEGLGKGAVFTFSMKMRALRTQNEGENGH